jgi:hypothetical protein
VKCIHVRPSVPFSHAVWRTHVDKWIANLRGGKSKSLDKVKDLKT